MRFSKRRMLALMSFAAGTLLAGGCSVGEQVVNTIRLAVGIADIWV